MTNKLVVIINSLKVPKIKKMLLYEIKFLVPNYSCLHNPWLGGYRSQIPVLCPLSSTEFVEPTPIPEKNCWVRHWIQTPATFVVGNVAVRQVFLRIFLLSLVDTVPQTLRLHSALTTVSNEPSLYSLQNAITFLNSRITSCKNSFP